MSSLRLWYTAGSSPGEREREREGGREGGVIELTVCFETSYNEAHNRKIARYADLIEQIGQSPFNVHFLTLEVGSRGFISLPNFTTIKQQLLQCTKKQWEVFLMDVTRTTIEGSHKIWATRNWTDSSVYKHAYPRPSLFTHSVILCYLTFLCTCICQMWAFIVCHVIAYYV